MRKVLTILALLAASALLLGAKGCTDCEKLGLAQAAACALEPEGQACRDATKEWQAKCKPGPEPTPTPTPTPTPEPTPTPLPVGYLDGSRLMVKPGDMRPLMWGSVALAVERDQAARPDAWEDRGGRWCLLAKAAAIPAGFLRVSEQLAASQIKAGQIRWKDGALSDSLGVVRPGTTEVEEYHLYEYGGGCVATSAGSLVAVDWEQGEAPPPPQACPAPVPTRTWPDGTPHWWLACKVHGTVIDCTHMYRDAWDEVSATCPYCTAIGMGTIGGQPRCSCPMRPDGHPDRVACEDHVAGGKLVLQSRGGASCVRVADTMFEPTAGGCRLCSPDGSVCGEWH